MASAAPAPDVTRYKTEKIVGFAPEDVAAPFFLRCAAIAIDYILFMMWPVAALLWDRLVSDVTTKPGPGGWTWTFMTIFWVADFILFPLLRGQTIGKFLTGLTILNVDGTSIGLSTIALRHLLGYALTTLTLGFGFFSSVFSAKGRALHDVVAGTIVVRARRMLI